MQKIKAHIHLIIYCLVLLSPSFMFSFQGTFRAAYPLLILLVLINRWRAFLLTTLPIILLLPAAFFLQWTFKTPMNESFWLIIAGSNVNEASDYLKENAVFPLGITLVVLTYWAFLFKKVKLHSPLIVSKKLKTFLLAFLLVPIFHTIKGRENLLGEFNHHYTESFPLNIIFSYSTAQEDMKRFMASDSFENIADLEVYSSGPDEQTVVVVLGESARRDRLELFGAAAPNNPELRKIKDELYLFNDLISLHPHTVSALPVVLSKQTGIHEPFQANYSFVDVFKMAGFKTFWISNQASLWEKNNLIGRYARSADIHHFFHLHGANAPTMYDEAVLDLFKKEVNDNSKKKLFILHLQGSHYSFGKRYPRDFNKFEDRYDNTLLYTDYILSEVISTLKKLNVNSSMFYVSDHGLLLNECGKKYTHFDNKESFEVPAILWGSTNWKMANKNKLTNLAENTKKPLTTEVVFDSLAEISGINYSLKNEQLSFLSEKVNVGKRLVKTYSKIVNYDLGKNNSACHLE